MMPHRKHRRQQCHCGRGHCGRGRRGLAPLEFVLWLPVLLFVCALMVNIGTSQAWRVRGEIVARDAVWRTRWPRSGQGEPRPPVNVWPQSATINVVPDPQQITELQTQIQRAVVHGPLPNIGVRPLLQFNQGLMQGQSSIEREHPMLPKVGKFTSGTIRHPLLTGGWQVSEMHWQDGQGNRAWLPANTSRRTKALYELREQDPGLAQDFVDSLRDLFSMSNFEALRVLDRDEEIRRYLRGYVDFHPRINPRCELDPEIIREQEVERLISISLDNGQPRSGEIKRLPCVMGSFFKGMYEAAVQKLEQQIEEMKQDSTADHSGSIAAAEAEIAELQPKIEQLRDFLSGLQNCR